MSQLNQALRRALEIMDLLKAQKPLYAELDELTVELERLGLSDVEFPDGRTVRLVDNFAESNTQFRPAGIKRFELRVERKRGGGGRP